MHRRPTWVPRAKLMRYVNCLSNLLPSCVYKYINILYIYVCTHICVRVCGVLRALRARKNWLVKER
ncbi:hypothetical protein PUN28_017159 [Cardiocondyla obscurior]|uniref:Uncharacterized protein n=1 Tax=Cardiocondyla obscurior TaxID=286306 RepID=A0AAW2EKJ1_9HYME